MADTQQSTTSILPSVERIQQELARAKSIDDFFGKEGIFARLFADTLEQMLEAELTAHLGYPRHAPEGRNSGNSRNGKRVSTKGNAKQRSHSNAIRSTAFARFVRLLGSRGILITNIPGRRIDHLHQGYKSD